MPIRPATPADAADIARVHVASWRTTYAGLIPAEIIATRTEERLTTQWQRNLTSGRGQVFVATDADGAIIGFASCGPCHDAAEATRFTGELYAIYLLHEVQGQGVGQTLISAVVSWLIGQGMTSMLVWVLAENPARRFYERLGGRYVGEKMEQMGNATLREVAYGWDDISGLRDQQQKKTTE